ncbi:unnamed protein product, partial [Ilex paraguariensis]
TPREIPPTIQVRIQIMAFLDLLFQFHHHPPQSLHHHPPPPPHQAFFPLFQPRKLLSPLPGHLSPHLPPPPLSLKCPFKTKSNTFFRLVSTTHGLLCLSDDHFGYTSTLILWNPSLRKYVTLPQPRICYDSYGPYMFALGCGFDTNTNDYKVVRIAYVQHRPDSWEPNSGISPQEGYLVPPQVEVFSLRNNSWKPITSNIPQHRMVEYFWSSVFVNGAIHWLGYCLKKQEGQSYSNVIIGFDVGGEIFKDLSLPKMLVDEYPLNLSISVCGEMITVFQYDSWPKSQRCCVWVMKEYGVVESWSKQFTVELSNIYAVLGFRRNGEVLIAKSDGEVVLYNPKSNGVGRLRFVVVETHFLWGILLRALFCWMEESM